MSPTVIWLGDYWSIAWDSFLYDHIDVIRWVDLKWYIQELIYKKWTEQSWVDPSWPSAKSERNCCEKCQHLMLHFFSPGGGNVQKSTHQHQGKPCTGKETQERCQEEEVSSEFLVFPFKPTSRILNVCPRWSKLLKRQQRWLRMRDAEMKPTTVPPYCAEC